MKNESAVNEKNSGGGVALLLTSLIFANQALAAPANTVVVAKTGGDFTSIQAAINATFPTANDPLLIQVMPGIYEEIITLKNYTSLKGSGMDVTIIKNNLLSASCTITAYALTNVAISDLTITSAAPGVNGDDRGICVEGGTSATITRNKIVGNYVGIMGQNSPTAIPEANLTISDNDISGNNWGVSSVYETISVVRNKVSNNIGVGLFLGGAGITRTKLAKALYNEATGNGTTLGDISGGANVNVSFNIVNNIKTKGTIGLYNVTTTGTAARLP